jgi:peptidoglycan hydrolase-like protein with peptidoglycan-binding domain
MAIISPAAPAAQLVGRHSCEWRSAGNCFTRKMRKLTISLLLGLLVAATTAAPASASGLTAAAPQSTPAASTTHKSSATSGKKKKSSRRRSSRREPFQKAPTADRISEIQTALSRGGYFEGNPNGKWDSNTVAAMQKFQSANGLNSSGKIDATTLQKLGLGSSTAGLNAPKPPKKSDPSAAANVATRSPFATNANSASNGAAPSAPAVSPASSKPQQH